MAAVQCTKCTAERKGFRRELDSWRHRLIHCVGFECILEGIYGPMLLQDLNLFVGCEPEEVDDWSPEASRSQCSFCNLSLDKLSDPVPAAMSPPSSPSDLSPCLALTISESSQSAHRFLQAVFHKKDVPTDCDSNIPLVAQELMKKMIREFAVEYASKCLLRTNTNGVTRSSSPLSETSDAPLDLTVSRMLEEKASKPDPDGVLDLSNRNFASSATSSANHKALGSQLPSVTEELGDLGQRGTKFRQSSALDTVLRSLCPAHQSLLYQILKLAHQEQMLPFLNHKHVSQAESHCCYCGVSPQDTLTYSVTPNECKAHNLNVHCTSAKCDHQTQCGAVYHPGDSKTGCSIHHHHPFRGCNSEGQRGSSYGCVQRCRIETLCSQRLHCVSCQSLAAGHRHNIASSFVPSPVLSQSPLCSPSSRLCCNPNHICRRQVENMADGGVGDGSRHCPVLQREQSPSPPPLSPIPSDISKKTDEKPPSLLHHRQVEEADLMVKCTSVSGSHMGADVTAATDSEQQCKTPESSQAEQIPSGTLLQDVVNRFSQKLETITSIDRDPTLLPTAICVTEKELPQFPSTSQSLQCHADAHLTEIITTVLHTGSASDYSLSELFNKHDKEPKSPNTRYRRRQEVLVAIATPADDASTRRQSLQIKRELARFDQSIRRRGPQTKKARLKNGNHSLSTSGTSLDPDLIKEVSKRETKVGIEPVETNKVMKATLSTLSVEREREEVEDKKTVLTKELQAVKVEESEREITEEKQLPIQKPELQSTRRTRSLKDAQTQVTTVNSAISNQLGSSCRKDDKGSIDKSHEKIISVQNCDTDNTPGKNSYSPVKEGQKCQSDQSKGIRRSTRNIVPPQWISSYVTEPRLFFPGSFSDSNLNSIAQSDKALPSSTLDSFSKDKDASSATHLSSPEHTGKLACETTQKEDKPSNTDIKGPYQSMPQTAVKEESSEKRRSDDIGCASSRRLRSSSRRQQVPKMPKNSLNEDVTIKSTPVERPFSSHIQYSSPIKLMFVSPVKDKGGVKYSLKSVGSGSSTQTKEFFDPYEASSWSGAPQKSKSQDKKCAPSPVKSDISQGKSATLCTRSTSSPVKSKSSPAKPTTLSAKSTPSPTKSITSPAKLTPLSAKSTPSPAKSTPSPAKSTPVKSPLTPSPTKSTPAKSPSTPAKSTASPAKSTASPAKSTASPAKSTASPAKSTASPAKSTASPAKSTASPAKSTASPARSIPVSVKSASSPLSVSSSPKSGSRRSRDSTPSKRLSGTESQQSPDNVSSLLETTPLKRRPGRPKKLGPHLEIKVKRPIGRPRKQKVVEAAVEAKALNGKCLVTPDVEDSVNKNLKITVVYGRSRRNKRTVSEGFDKLQTDFSDVLQGVDLKGDLGLFLHHSKKSLGSIKTASEEKNLVSPAKEPTPLSTSNIKCVKRDESTPLRKPGRPAKVKISGISVTVTTVSPRQRKILINKQRSPETHPHKKTLLPEVKPAKEPRTITHQLTSKRTQTEEGLETNEPKDEQPNQSVAVRHSMRVRKPSIHFLHAVATSSFRTYSRSNALLRRSKQLLLTKESNERRQEQQNSVEMSGEKRQFCGQERGSIPQDLSRVAAVSVDSIFSPKETLRWWAASAEENTLNQELARRIRLISDTWVTDTENQDDDISLNSTLDTKGSSSLTTKSKSSSVVRALFDCSPNQPRSCSMQQICSWFMQTTETQPLAIVKKASSRNPYELMHFPRSANKKSVCHSPQAERLRKHIKKFAKTVPKSPLQHRRAQLRLKKNKIRRRLFFPSFAMHKRSLGVLWWRCSSSGKYKATLVRARSRFLTQKERRRDQKRGDKKKAKVAMACSNGPVVTGRRLSRKASHRSVKDQFSDCLKSSSATCSVNRTQELVDAHKEQNICSKAWSPETLKECRVFLRKINSPDNESAEEEWDSCTVTLDNGSPSAYLFAGKERELVGVVKAVKSERQRSTSNTRQQTGSAAKSVQKQDAVQAGKQRGKRSPGVVSTELPQPPPAKKLRQSRMRGLTGPRWCDFVFEN